MKSISVYDALRCNKVKCKHLNLKNYSFQSKDIIQNDSIYMLKKLGMPIKGSKEFGNLYIKFTILLPTKYNPISQTENEIMKKYLSISCSSEQQKQDTKCIECNITKCNETSIDTNLLNYIKLNV